MHLADQKTVVRTTEIVRGVLSVISNLDSLDKVLLLLMTLVTERLCVQYLNILERHNRGR